MSEFPRNLDSMQLRGLLWQAALADLRIPHIDVTMGEGGEDPELDLDDDPERAIALDTSQVPLLVTVTQVP